MARTKTRFTSIQALRDYAASGAKMADRHRILLHLKDNPDTLHTRRSVSDALGIPVNIVSGRVNDMIADNVIAEGPEPVSCPSTRRSVHSILANPAYSGSQF